MTTKPFSDTEIIAAVGIKLKQMRDEAQAERDKLRNEMKAELMALRNEFLRDRIDAERGIKRRTSPLPVHDMIELN